MNAVANDYLQVLKEVEQGNIRPVYLIYGEETYLRQKLLTSLKEQILLGDLKDFNYQHFDGRETFGSVITAGAETLPVMADKRLVTVSDALFFSSQAKYRLDTEEEKQLMDYLEQPNPSTCLVFYLTEKLDGKKKLVKVAKQHSAVVEAKKLYGNTLSKWVEDMFTLQGKKIDRSGLSQLLTVAGDLSIIEQEVEKLLLFAGQEQVVTRAMVDATLSSTVEADVFKLVDALGEKRPQLAVGTLREILLVGEPPVKVLAMIARQFRMLLALKDMLDQGYSTKQAGSKIKAPPWLLSKLIRQTRNFTISDLEAALIATGQLDLRIKRYSLNPARELEFLVLKACGK